jgi:hypothetical protein
MRVMDIGVQSRDGVTGAVRLLMDAFNVEGSEASSLAVLTDSNVLGGEYSEFHGTPDELLDHFYASNALGFRMLLGQSRIILATPPKSFGTVSETWRVYAERRDDWAESLLDKIIELPAVEYAVICCEEALDLDAFAHVDTNNFPWEHWRLIAARIRKSSSGSFVNRREPQQMKVQGLRFVREHDGEPERILKGRLVEAFRQRADVQRAYLAQVINSDQTSVALCLKNVQGRPDLNLIKEIGSIFAAQFARQMHLDILFINESQESALRSVCVPFYPVKT